MNTAQILSLALYTLSEVSELTTVSWTSYHLGISYSSLLFFYWFSPRYQNENGSAADGRAHSNTVPHPHVFVFNRVIFNRGQDKSINSRFQ
jgi:hypothetical protein